MLIVSNMHFVRVECIFYIARELNAKLSLTAFLFSLQLQLQQCLF